MDGAVVRPVVSEAFAGSAVEMGRCGGGHLGGPGVNWVEEVGWIFHGDVIVCERSPLVSEGCWAERRFAP